MCIQLSTTTTNSRHAMRRVVTVASLCLGLFATEQAFGQGGTGLAPDGAGHQNATSCLILERVGAVDKVISRALSLGIRGKQFQYVEGKLPEGISFRDKLTERDINELQARGSEIVIVSSDLMPDELQQARNYCLVETHKSRVQTSSTQIEIASTPPGSDIDIDGKFIGSTPSSVKLALGEHLIKVSKNGYATWERTMNTVAGTVRISPELQPAVPTHDSTRETRTNVLSTAGQPF